MQGGATGVTRGTCVNIILRPADKIGQADTGEMFTDDDNLGYVR